MAEEEKVEIIEQEYQPSRWTFLNYMRSIKRFKWWLLGFSIAGALAGYFGFKFLLNPSKKVLTATYTYDLAGTYEDTDTIRFIDGTTFNPYDLTNRANLEIVKNSDEKYAKVDIDGIIDDGSITIYKNVTYYNNNDTENTSITYSVSAKAAAFPSDTLGKEFVYDLITLPKGLSTSAINNYNAISYFTDNFDTLTFERQISQLSSQYNQDSSVYTNLSNRFGSSVVANKNGNKLYELHNKFTSSYYTSSVQSFAEELKATLNSKKYVNYTEGKEAEKITEIKELCENYIETIETDKKQLAIYEAQLDKLVTSTALIGTDTNVSSQITNYNNNITSLKLNINNLDEELNDYGYFYDEGTGEYVLDEGCVDSSIYQLTHKNAEWVNGCKAFKAKINNYKASLENDRGEATTVFRYCYAEYQNRVNIQNGGYINLSGGMSSLIGLAIGLVGGFLLTSLVTMTIYVYKKED